MGPHTREAAHDVSLEALADYVYRSPHTAYLRRRAEWFERMREVFVALWWVPAGHVDPWVDHAARMTYDTTYGGCGNGRA